MTYPTNSHAKGSRPFFSIVIPTRERGHLLRHALRSALSQTFGDYEIIVCDNYSTDNTEEVVRELADERVRYVRTRERLSMSDNWEFGFEHIRGDYVAYLGDDDAISPDLLEKLHEILVGTPHVSVMWARGAYYHPDWPEKEKRCILSLPDYPRTGKVLEHSSSSLLKKMFALERIEDVHYPLLHQSCCSREFLEQRKRRMGRLFFPTCPDFSSAVAILTGTDHILFIDEYLHIFGAAGASNTSMGFPETNAMETFMNEFSELEKIWRIPLKSNTAYNHIAVTLIGLKDVLTEELAPYSLSITNLFIRDHEQIELMRSRGTDVSRVVEHWNRALATQSPKVRRAVRKATAPTSVPTALAYLESPPISRRLKTATKNRFPGMVHRANFVRAWLSKKWRDRRNEKQRAREKRYKTSRFDNIFEAARALGKLH